MATFSGISDGQLQLLGVFPQDVNSIVAFDMPTLTQEDYLMRTGLMLVQQIPPGLNPRTLNVIKVFGSGLLFRPGVLVVGLSTAVYVDWYVTGLAWTLETGSA